MHEHVLGVHELFWTYMRYESLKPLAIFAKCSMLSGSEEAYFFSIRVFFHGHWQLTGRQGKGEDHFLFHSTTSTRSRTFRNLLATLHVRWLSHIFNGNACIYQTATRWDLPPDRITIWLIDCDIDFCLLAWIDFRLCFSYLTWETGGLELASTIILELQANRLTKCVSHPRTRVLRV